MQGCSDSSNETGTVITKPPAVAEREKKAMEGNQKAMMKIMANKNKKKR
jgi:hypothetical protein